jgi:hypothetical protein
MTKKYIRQHMGLGDHIICNGLVRHFCEQYDDIAIFCKDVLYENVKFMFRDIKHLDVIPFEDKTGYYQFVFKNGRQVVVDNLSDYQCLQFIKENNIDFENDIIHIGFDGLGGLNTRFDKAFYKMHGFDPSFRLDNFYCERNFEYEDYVFNFLNPNNEKYIFVVDDDKHQFGSLTIDESRLPKQYKIIKYDKTLNYNDSRFLMYNYRKILENAEEVHMFQSAFSEFVNSIELQKPKIYFHLYLRDYTDGEPILSKNKINIVE